MQPREQPGVLRPRHGAGEALEHVVMGIDQAGNDDVAAQVQDLVGGLRQIHRPPDGDHAPVPGEQAAARDFPALPVHRDEHLGVPDEEGRHYFTPP